jgi:hypothetical protein
MKFHLHISGLSHSLPSFHRRANVNSSRIYHRHLDLAGVPLRLPRFKRDTLSKHGDTLSLPRAPSFLSLDSTWHVHLVANRLHLQLFQEPDLLHTLGKNHQADTLETEFPHLHYGFIRGRRITKPSDLRISGAEG